MSTDTATTSPWLRIAAVAAGGFLGGLLRYIGLRIGVEQHWGVYANHSVGLMDLVGTRLLVINTIGVFIATRLLLGPMGQSHPDAPRRIFWTTGVLGGLTTYSSLVVSFGSTWSSYPGLTLVAIVINLGAAGAAVSAALAWNRRGS